MQGEQLPPPARHANPCLGVLSGGRGLCAPWAPTVPPLCLAVGAASGATSGLAAAAGATVDPSARAAATTRTRAAATTRAVSTTRAVATTRALA